jgi:OOP family OmpA-OmpF porin
MRESEDQAAFEALRRLLLNPEQDQLAELDADLKEPERLADHLQQALPLAIKHSAGKNSRLSEALTPILEEAIQTSIRRNPRLMAEILFPIIGRAVRKAVWEAWSQLIQTVNGLLETRVSLKSLRWRWLAWRTGRSFAEIVLAQTFVYRVEQVFLIHRETGLLLAHEMREAGVAKDKELVSAMLTAIQDFVRDSFEIDDHTPLGALEVGGLKVWIKEGPHAYIAGVIRGNPPEELHAVLSDTLERVHFEFDPVLQDYNGEGDEIAAADQILLDAMRYERQGAEGTGVPWYAVLVALILTGLMGWNAYLAMKTNQRLNAMKQVLDNTPGYRVLSLKSSGDELYLEGFRDPLAPAPEVVLQELLGTDRLQADLMPYIALQPELIQQRAQQLLSPPETIRLELDDQRILSAAGSAEPIWLQQFQERAAFVPGVVSIDSSSVTVLKTRKETLTEDLLAWELSFEVNQYQLSDAQVSEIGAITEKVKELHSIADKQNEIMFLVIQGFTDATGSLSHNQELALRRAGVVRDAFISMGVPQSILQVRGFTSQSDEKEPARRITLAIHHDQP